MTSMLEKGKSLTFFTVYTDKKENKIFLICKEIQMGSGAKSYMRKDFLIHGEMRKYMRRPLVCITLHLIHLNFIFFIISVLFLAPLFWGEKFSTAEFLRKKPSHF